MALEGLMVRGQLGPVGECWRNRWGLGLSMPRCRCESGVLASSRKSDALGKKEQSSGCQAVSTL